MHEERFYPRDKSYLLNVIGDMCELQCGKTLRADAAQGLVAFTTRMYGFTYTYHFSVTEEPGGAWVRLEMPNAGSDTMLYQAFSLLESLMAKRPEEDGTQMMEEER